MALSFLALWERTASKLVTEAVKTAWFVLKAPSVIRAPRNLHPAHREHHWHVKYQQKDFNMADAKTDGINLVKMKDVQYDLWCVTCSLFPQLHISQSKRRSEAGGLHCLPCWLFLSPLCHCQPQSVWSWQLFCEASSLKQDGVTGPLA